VSCTGVNIVNPACQIATAAGNVAQGASNIAESAFGSIASAFAQAATTATNWLWSQIDMATSVDITSPALRKEIGVTAAIALVICLGLFVLQLITAALRRDPGGLARAVKGLFIMALGSGFALAATRVLLAAVDTLADAVVQHTLGTSMRGIGEQLAVANLTTLNNPAVMLILAVAVLAATVIVWVAMMVRKMLLIICAVLAPLAFAGATADITRSWVRKWVEFVAAMIAAKLILVLILATGVAVMQGAGLAGSQPSQVGTQLAIGALILLLGGLSPWLAIRMCVFVGDSLYAAHVHAGHATTGARVAAAAPQKVAYLRSGLTASAGARAGGFMTATSGGGSSSGGPSNSGPAGPGASNGGNGAGPTLRPPGKGGSGSPLPALPGSTASSPGNGELERSASSRVSGDPGTADPHPTRAPQPVPQPVPQPAPHLTKPPAPSPAMPQRPPTSPPRREEP
jgi:hypothetical protein